MSFARRDGAMTYWAVASMGDRKNIAVSKRLLADGTTATCSNWEFGTFPVLGSFEKTTLFWEKEQCRGNAESSDLATLDCQSVRELGLGVLTDG